MRSNTEGSLGPAAAIYLAFVAFVAAANFVFGGPPAAAAPARQLIGGALLFFGAVTSVGIVAPLWLAARGRLTLPLWPAPGTWDSALAVLVVVYLFARVEMLGAILSEGRPVLAAAATFIGPGALHLASVIATIGVLLPALKRRMPAAPAAVIAALSFSLYHFAQFNAFPAGLGLRVQFTLGAFALGYALFYLWSRSLLLTALLQHLVATTTFIFYRDFGFGEVDAPFFYSALVIVGFTAFVVSRRRFYAAERFVDF